MALGAVTGFLAMAITNTQKQFLVTVVATVAAALIVDYIRGQYEKV